MIADLSTLVAVVDGFVVDVFGVDDAVDIAGFELEEVDEVVVAVVLVDEVPDVAAAATPFVDALDAVVVEAEPGVEFELVEDVVLEEVVEVVVPDAVEYDASLAVVVLTEVVELELDAGKAATTAAASLSGFEDSDTPFVVEVEVEVVRELLSVELVDAVFVLVLE